VIDEDGLAVDYEAVLAEAVRLGYESVMVDGSRLPLEENIEATRKVVGIARASGEGPVPVEAELGRISGHEAGPLPPYEELFASGLGFTDPEEAGRFVEATGADWLSVAVGSIHGAISAAKRREKKVEARLHVEHLDRIARAASVPLVLHGGTGIPREYVREGIRHGIAKINIATAIRQPYEAAVKTSVSEGQEAVHRAVVRIVREELEIEGSAAAVLAGS
jgi:fructose/tagatose bisphosphate aldolase